MPCVGWVRQVLVIVMAASCGVPDREVSDGATDPPSMQRHCSADGYAIADCHGMVVHACADGEACDPDTVTCDNACAVAQRQHRALGCTYYAVDLDGPEEKLSPPPYTIPSGCFSVSVSNAGPHTAHLSLSYRGASIDIAQYGRIRTGALESTNYQHYDNTVGLLPRQVLTIFLAGGDVNVVHENGVDSEIEIPCPIPALDPDASKDSSGIWDAFRIESDVPVAVHQVDPEGSFFPAATLLTATSGWGNDYTALDFGPPEVASRLRAKPDCQTRHSTNS